MLKLQQLAVFVHIADSGSVRAAAEKLFITQPAVSMALKQLEQQLDVRLFERDRGRLHLSEKGEYLLPRAREIMKRMNEFSLQAGSIPKTLYGQLRLGASNTVGNYLVGDLLGKFVRAEPHVGIHLKVDNTRTIVDQLEQDQLDIGCVEGVVLHPNMEVRYWRQDELAIYVANDHPLAFKKMIERQDFAGARWIVREPGSATRTQTERALANLPAGEMVLELGQIEAIKQAVAAGLGMAFLPQVAALEAQACGRLVKLATPFLDLTRRLSLIWPRHAYKGLLLERFLMSL